MPRNKKKLTHARAHEVFRYSRSSGKLYWKVTLARAYHSIGDEAGCVYSNRGKLYRKVQIDGRTYQVHRVIWLLAYGRWPEYELDHEDGNGLNNRLSNLRDVLHKVGMQNRRRQHNNASGQTGVFWYDGRNRWVAHIGKKYLGCFVSFDTAVKTRKRAATKYGFHINHGREAV
jgi:hypothetical protein